jgi:hypothetical protein
MEGMFLLKLIVLNAMVTSEKQERVGAKQHNWLIMLQLYCCVSTILACATP